MDASGIMSKILGLLGTAWSTVFGVVGSFFRRFRFLFLWLIIAGIALYATARVTYWYQAVYKPAEELKANPPVSVEQILQSLDVTLGDFDMPKGLGATYLDDSFFFALTPGEAWNDEAISNLWIPANEMGLEKISGDSDQAMADIVSNLP